MSTVIEIHNTHAAGPSIRLHANDNVFIARADVGIGVALPQEGITTRAPVTAGDKIAPPRVPRAHASIKYTDNNLFIHA